MTRGFPKSLVVLWLGVFVLSVGALRAREALTPLGNVHSSGVVYLGKQAAGRQAVIFSGDQLTTEEGQALISFPGGDLVELERQSEATLQYSAEGPALELERGKLSLAVTARRPIRIVSSGLTLSPNKMFPSLSEVARNGDGSLVVAVRRGQVSVANLRKEPIIVSAGQMMTIHAPAAQSQEGPVGTGAHGKTTLGEKLRTFRIGGLSHGASVALVGGGIGGGAAAGIIVATDDNVVSRSTP